MEQMTDFYLRVNFVIIKSLKVCVLANISPTNRLKRKGFFSQEFD